MGPTARDVAGASPVEAVDLPPPAEPVAPLGPRHTPVWLLQQMFPGSSVSNLAYAFTTRNRLRWWPLHVAANQLLARHPVLRTRFPAHGGVPMRHVCAAEDVQLRVEVVTADRQDLPEVLGRLAADPFDLEKDLAVRLVHVEVDGGGSAVLLLGHHLVTDARGLARLARELTTAYDEACDGPGGSTPGARDTVPRTDPSPAPERVGADLRYWGERLRDVATPRPLWDASSPGRPCAAPAFLVSRHHGPEVGAAIQQLRRSTGTTPAVVLLGLYGLLLSRHGAGTDVVLGVPVDTTAASDDAPVDLNVATLPLRVRVDRDATVNGFLRETGRRFLDGLSHLSVSAEDIVPTLGVAAADWRMPLFRHGVDYRPGAAEPLSMAGETPEPFTVPPSECRLDLELHVVGDPASPTTIAVFDRELHTRTDVETLLHRLGDLLVRAARSPEARVGDLEVGTDDEVRVIAGAASTGPAAGDADLPVHRAIRAVAARHADRAAVVDSDGDLSFGRLTSQVRLAARRLAAAVPSVGEARRVGVLLPRGRELIVTMLAAWEAGLTAVPVGYDQPPERIAVQLETADVGVVVAGDAGTIPRGLHEGRRVLTWHDLEDAGPHGAGPLEVGAGAGPDDEAYVLFTSGSTGSPHGVAVTHANLANVLAAFTDTLRTGPDDVMLWSTTPTFDVSFLEWLLALVVGATVVVADEDVALRPERYVQSVEESGATLLQATPTFWRTVAGRVPAGEWGGRRLLCGGEPLPPDLARSLVATGASVLNVYGPTETTIWSTVEPLAAEVPDPMVIGRPVRGTRVRVDGGSGPCPPGVAGELWISGLGVARGYVGDPEATTRRFVGTGGDRWFRTGDVARWTGEGRLVVSGRLDRQVKLRGHRVEPGEIEAAALQHPAVTEAAAVVAHRGTPEAVLVLFLVAGPDPPADLEGALWHHLRDLIPDPHLPGAIRVVERLVLTSSHKVDHGALERDAERRPDPTPPAAHDVVDDATVREVLEVWREVLGRPRLADRDNFFLSGGHSLLAAQVADRLRTRTGRRVELRWMFEHPTARTFSTCLRGADVG